ncbi:hypothetical protein GCM10028827_37740 [Mucilaginibacter myungsuensis]
MINRFAFLGMEKEINSFSSLNEKLAFINGYLNSIANINTTANNGMEHWIVDLGLIEDNIVHTIKKGINAPTWTFRSVEISDWQKVIEDECIFFFSNILSETHGSSKHYLDMEKNYHPIEKYDPAAQLKYFIKIIEDLLSSFKLRSAYKIEIDWGPERYSDGPYFAHGESNFAFQIGSNHLLYLHLGASD